MLPLLFTLFNAVFQKLVPAGSVAMLPFLAVMLLSLASSLYTVHRMLRRKDLSETIMALAVPYVLFGTLFIMEPLVTASLFGAKNLLSSVVLIMANQRLYMEILILIAIFAVSAWLFIQAAVRRMGGTRLGQALRNCGLEILLSLGLIVISILARFSMAPIFLLTDLGLNIFLYALLTVVIKTAVNLFLVLYTMLFRPRPEKPKAREEIVEQGRDDMPRVRRFVRKKAGYMAVLLGLFLLIFGLAVVSEVGFSLWYIDILIGWLLVFWLYQALRFLLPDMTTLRRFHRWGNEDDIAAQFCKEFFEAEPIRKKDQYTVTPRFLVDEFQFGVKIYYLPQFERQSGRTLRFADGSRCRLRESLQGFNMAEYVKEHTAKR